MIEIYLKTALQHIFIHFLNVITVLGSTALLKSQNNLKYFEKRIKNRFFLK